ncbi:MAG: hypothetical protein M1819_006328 [Sarea resinae]|nr:MAG: hypothetical protein M1819_006328 [Sarea resinae]
MAEDERAQCYTAAVEEIREREYPMLKDTVYLDHAGTTPYAKSLMERFSFEMTTNLFGNPHSASPSSQLSTQSIENIRLRVLRFFNADPDDFDVVFVANATAGIKLVTEGFRNQKNGFRYSYHRDAHTSLIGVREEATSHVCFESDQDVERWLSDEGPEDTGQTDDVGLFAFPAQSNMNGRRLPLEWCGRLRSFQGVNKSIYSLLDAAALVSTSPLDLGKSETAPDFTVLSFYKIFGFPDLGALIVRKDSGHILQKRKYFGGGTVDMVLCLEEQWHVKKEETLHEQLEDGTLPIHSIIALGCAMDVHQQLYTSMDRISRHTGHLAEKLYHGLSSLRHGKEQAVCVIYKDPLSDYLDPKTQGPIIAFNIRSSQGAWASNTEFEKLAAVKNIQLRSGGLCNPGGVSSALDLAPWEMKRNLSAGQRCGNENDVMSGKPTGVIRVALGAMSSMRDVEAFVGFVREFFVERKIAIARTPRISASKADGFRVESLMVYPIKSCAGFRIPMDCQWEVRNEGLAWDREWCLVHQGTGVALSQKKYPKMALIRPSIDLESGVLRVQLHPRIQKRSLSFQQTEMTVPLSADPTYFEKTGGLPAKVCGDLISAHKYTMPHISEFFTAALGVPCTLVRFPAASSSGASTRHAKAHLRNHQLDAVQRQSAGVSSSISEDGNTVGPLLLSNESPILTISTSSLNRLNEQIKSRGGKAASAEVFRANIVVAEAHDPGLDLHRYLGTLTSPLSVRPRCERPYIEDRWRYLHIGTQSYQCLGPCRRCQMVCVDQETAEKNEEPFVTLAKTRRFNGRVFFGQHTRLLMRPAAVACSSVDADPFLPKTPTIAIGDPVRPIIGETDELFADLKS